ncbi:ubiquitin-like protein 4A-B isoform X2 [Limulus polyphemus]|uniref:Ubiquitin-like protein 4A-B isoform X2 n=1 Tax=Limulus polyphemus TaxID=6850 RepID=A0ABM1B335_LIMPO|nr:ubiquitin-like protein 4A-B isoform X2 [Limulus polyphemus]
MLISVKILQGKECSIEVAASTSINDVKQLVAQQLDIPVDQQRLVFKGKTLSDGSSLCDYNIVEGNKLHLFVRKEEKDASSMSQSTVLWDELENFLLKHFTPNDAKKVLMEFKKDFTSSVTSLSLDDIERIAITNLDVNAVFSDEHCPPWYQELSTVGE